MPMPSDAPALAASFTLGCMLIHACRREAATLTAFLILVIGALSLMLLVLMIDRGGNREIGITAMTETSERAYGFE